ncbi:MAG TPA: energy-coupling factor transporter transmembrane component T [Candidatus Limnocylindrales bacterium]|nr:energy-coupling factor transporter transmembrane component T [Candidatus Limnocylindrales bacterium]
MASATGYFRPGHSWLHRRHPITKLLGLAWVLLADFLLSPAVLPMIGAGLVLLALACGLGRAVAGSLRIPAVLIASILVVNALVFPGAAAVLFAIGPLGVTREGLEFGVVSAGRLLIAFIASVLFLLTTLADDLLEALVSRGVSHRIAFVLLSAVQTVPRLQSRAASIIAAQEARGLATVGSLRQRARALVPLVGPLLLSSLLDVRERTLALEARAFGARAHRTAYRVVPDPPADRWLRAAFLVGIVGVAVAAAGRVL